MNKIFLIAVLGLLCSFRAEASRFNFNPNRVGSCTVELQARNGAVLDSFQGRDCYEAQDNCEWELTQRQRRGQNPLARCIEVPAWGGGDNGGDFQIIDEVFFRHSNTYQAILACQAGLQRDERCTRSGYSCSQCSQIAHSDQSSYVVYSDERSANRRTFLETFHFSDRQTAVAYQKCVTVRDRMPECSSPRYECTPCTLENHTDHSEFSLYDLGRRR